MTKIKICGLSRPKDIEYVNEAGPDFAGFVINFPRSHRSVSPDEARLLIGGLRDDITPVGVVVNMPIDEAAALLCGGVVKILQLHGDEDEEYITKLRERAPGHEIWKAFKVRCAEDIKKAARSSADEILLDNGQGTGEAFNWKLLEGKKHRRFILAGGLTPENLGEAIEKIHPYCVDISSGVETDKLKDREKILAVTECIRNFNAKKSG